MGSRGNGAADEAIPPPHVLREYALLADGERGALCDPRGTIAWLCAPRWHDDAICSALLGGPGFYAITPRDTYVWGGCYEPGSLIWRNRWVTGDGVVECRDALALPASPTRLVLLRRVVALDGWARLSVRLSLRAGFGSAPFEQLHRTDDGWTARTGGLHVRWTGLPLAEVDDDGVLVAELDLPPGHHADLVLEVDSFALTDQAPDAASLWDVTERAWADAVPDFASSVAPRDARHAYAVLRGLTSAQTGGMVAAVTLGLPERAEAGRNYDYRYVWLRDQAYAGIAAGVDEPLPLLDEAVRFVTARLVEHPRDLHPAYTVDGDELSRERELDLPGYPGGRPIAGNWVRGQFQLDAVGELLSLFAVAARHDHLDASNIEAARVAVAMVGERWIDDEAGIWELDDAWWTQSRLSCVAGLRAFAPFLPRAEGTDALVLADRVLAETSRRCLHPDGYWRRKPGLDTTDASLVLAPVRGALPADDPRTRATLRRVHEELVEDGHAYRFREGHEPLGQAEGSFSLCGFGLSLAHWHQGESVEAFRWFERTRSACGSPGLLSEEFDVQQRQLRGNLPQAFVHAALLETAQRLAQVSG